MLWIVHTWGHIRFLGIGLELAYKMAAHAGE